MPDAEAVTGIAREMMGVLSRGATGEFGMLARLLGPDEPILAMAVVKPRDAGWLFAGRVLVATPQRLLVVGKAMLTRREKVEEIALDRIRGGRATPPASLEIDLDDGVLRFAYVGPPPQLSALADLARGRPGPPRFVELDELARRKLGRLLGFCVEGSLVALVEELAPDEAVIDLAVYGGKPGGTVVVCDTRLMAVPDKGFGNGTPLALPFDEIVEISEAGEDLVVRTHDGEHRFQNLTPSGQASVIAARVRARIRPV